jgi:hypothetical protein
LNEQRWKALLFYCQAEFASLETCGARDLLRRRLKAAVHFAMLTARLKPRLFKTSADRVFRQPDRWPID